MRARLRLLLPLAWRSLWRNPRRTVITLMVVAVGLWSILVFAVLLQAWAQSSRDTTLKLVTGEGELHAPGYLDDPTAAHAMAPPGPRLAALLASPDVTARAARTRVGAIVQSEYRTLPLTLIGVTPDQERGVSMIPSQVAQGRYLTGPDDAGIVLGRHIARRLKTRVGKRVVIMAQGADGHLAEQAFQVVGLYAAAQEAEDEFAFTGIGTARSMLQMGDGASEIAFDARSDKALAGLIAQMRQAAPGLDIQSWRTLAPLAYAVSTFFEEFVMMWFWMMFALMAIGIVNTQLMAVFERRREFGLLQALGMRPRLVLLEVALESTLLVGAGVLVGLMLSIITVLAFPKGLDLGFLGRGAESVGAGRILYPRVDPGVFALYGAVVWGLGVVATLWPAHSASKVSPVEAMAHAA